MDNVEACPVHLSGGKERGESGSEVANAMSCPILIAKPDCLACPCTTPLHCGSGQVQVGDSTVTASCRDLERVGVPDAMLHLLPGTHDTLTLDE